MRKLLLALLLLPVASFAQHFEIGINGGFDFHSLPLDNNIAHQDKAILGYVGGATVDLLVPHAQIGIGVAITQLTETNYIAPNYTMKIYNHLANPLTTPYAFYNYVWTHSNAYSYAGGMAGLAIASVGVNSFEYTGTNVSRYTTNYNTAFGMVAGVQAGFVIKASKHIGIGGEAAMRYTAFKYSPPNNTGVNPYDYKLFYFPFTVCVKYRILAKS